MGLGAIGKLALRRSFSSKLFEDLVLMVRFLKIMGLSGTKDLLRYSLAILVGVFAVRAVANGVLVPYAISHVINFIRDGDSRGSIAMGAGLFGASAALFLITELALFKYFKSLTDGIVEVKRVLIRNISLVRSEGRDSPEDLVGKLANDVDFIVWNINGVLTTLLPNLLTGIASAATVASFSHQIGALTAVTLIPYIVYAEAYSRRIETYRSEERRSYSVTMARIKDIVYGGSDDGGLERALGIWRSSVLNIIWMDRLYWGASLATAFTSMSLIAVISTRDLREDRIDPGSMAGILSAALTAHMGMLNAMWAMCVQGQTSAAIKRLIIYSKLFEKAEKAVGKT
jgi:ABC-type multidrug transport system fused ATPase/permease subunit